MQIEDFRVNPLTLVLLVASTGVWIDLIRVGLRDRWTWPIEPRQPVPWQLLEAVAFIVIVLLTVTILLMQAFNLPESPPYTVRHLQVECLSRLIQIAMVPLFLSVWCRCQWADFGLRRQGLLKDLRFAVWGLLLAFLPVSLFSFPLQSLRKAESHLLLKMLHAFAGDTQTVTWIAVAVVLTGPLLEELLFRVLLQGALEREVSPFWAIVISSCAFVSIHSSVDWLPLMPLALIFGYVYYRRRSYLSVVVLHSLFNGLNLLIALWNQQSAV